VLSGATSTDVPSFHYTSYYEDNSVNPTTQCTGDLVAYGSSGPYVNMTVPNTDPGVGPANYLNTMRTLYYEPPGLTVADAASFSARANTPLSVATLAWTPPVGGIAHAVNADELPLSGSGRLGGLAAEIALFVGGAGLIAMLAVAVTRRLRASRPRP